MKTLKLQKRIASKILDVGINKIYFDPERLNEAREAITKQDVEDLIKEGAIKKRPTVGHQRRSGKIRDARKTKGRKRGIGSKRKRPNTRKKDYVNKIRKMRSVLKHMKQNEEISRDIYSNARRLAKSGTLKSRKELLNYIKENK